MQQRLSLGRYRGWVLIEEDVNASLSNKSALKKSELPFHLLHIFKLLVRVQVIMSSAQDVAVEIQTTLNYQFNHVQPLLEALKAAGAGFSIQHARSAKDGNKRLAHVGNLALQMVISNAWYHADEERGLLHTLHFGDEIG
jgi:hypothetical protein